jgi:SlyX protein
MAITIVDTLSDTDKRLTELEVKASFTEDLLDDLNRIVARQQQQIDALLLQVADPGATRSLRDELPPHY